jgi:hypothetical protein
MGTDHRRWLKCRTEVVAEDVDEEGAHAAQHG